MATNASNAGTVNVEIAGSFKQFSNFWGALEMPLIDCEVSLIMNWPANCVICEVNTATIFQ